MKCSAVVDRACGRVGRTGTEMLTEILEWRTDRRDLSVLVKKITDIICTAAIEPTDGSTAKGRSLDVAAVVGHECAMYSQQSICCASLRIRVVAAVPTYLRPT